MTDIRRETEALIGAIWGPAALDPPARGDPAVRERQNAALASALKAYLQEYLVEAEVDSAPAR